jgi:hypothetical protein
MEPPGPASGRPDDKLHVIRGQPIPDCAALHPGYKAAAHEWAWMFREPTRLSHFFNAFTPGKSYIDVLLRMSHVDPERLKEPDNASKVFWH